MKKIILMLFLLTCFLAPNPLWALTQAEVSQLYVSIIGRASEGAGNIYWQTDPSSTSMTVTANVMLNTEAAMAYFGPTLDDNKTFVEHIYINTFGKTYAEDPGGVNYWVNALYSGKSKGEVVAAIIVAAQDPVNAGAAQDRFNNRVEVSNYCADMIINFTETVTFKDFIDNVTDVSSTINRAFESILEQAGNVSNVLYIGKIISGFDNGSIFSEQSGIFAEQTENGGYDIHTEKRVTDIQTDSEGVVVSSTGTGNTRNFSVWKETSTSINSIKQVNDGGYLLAGSKEQYELPPSGQDFDWDVYPNGIPKGGEAYLLKTDASGIEVWSDVFPFAIDDNLWSEPYYGLHSEIQGIYPALDGGYILEVYAGDQYPRDLYLIHVDDSGSKIWFKNYEYSESYYNEIDLIQAHDSGYIIIGNDKISNDLSSPSNLLLTYIDNAGNEIWNKIYEYDSDGESDPKNVSLQKTTDGNYLLSGRYLGSSSPDESCLIKINTSGNELWRLTVPYNQLNVITETLDGGYLLLVAKATLIKINNQGEVVLERSFVGENMYAIDSVAQTSDGGFILYGTTGGDQIAPAVVQGCDIWLIRTDSNGNEIWSREFDLGGNERGGHVFQTSENDFVLLGTTQGHPVFSYGYLYRPESIYFIKVDVDGNVIQ